MKRMTGLAVVLAVSIALAAAMAACGDREPQEHVFNLELQGGELVDGGAAWQVNQDDKVTLNVRSDQPVNFHLHGYDLEQDITPEEPGRVCLHGGGHRQLSDHRPPGRPGHGDGRPWQRGRH